MEAYLDNWLTTRMAPEVMEAMRPFMEGSYGVPSGLYGLSMEADRAVERAREAIARPMNADPTGIHFTSGATEANNLAIVGALRANRKRGRHVITTAVEHPSVLETCEQLAREGEAEVDFLKVDGEGFIGLDQLACLVREDTVLVSILYVNNIVGTIQPMEKIGDALASAKQRPLLHVDGVGAYGLMPLDAEKLGVDLLSISSHKIHGPKGVGALWVRKGTRLAPLMRGVNSMSNLRPGDENVPGIVGFGRAAELAGEGMDRNLASARKLWERFVARLGRDVQEAKLNGPRGDRRSPYNINFSFSSIEGEAVTLELDSRGISVSTGSACASKRLKSNHVMVAMGKPPEEAHGSLRLTLSRNTTAEELDYTVAALADVFERLRKISAYRPGMEDKTCDRCMAVKK